ncbi:DUF3857 domain-containing protein [Pedobacter duraquae]|uniref:Uncharacterized protein DUF3857 n=1 Tax=Pedobacter duraquae TaxID=425511 RepID=A0A4R6IE39_9SPHI|nr:DUF3857 domain-containing protein [Pedobacter duraquae]TDO19986.1 uncharacterized protein DUF3857 [Pedobacter duraquae]
MKLAIYLSAVFMTATLCVRAQNPYDVAKISPAMLVGSTAVVRSEECAITVKNVGSATMSYKTAITILTKNAESLASMSEYYDRLSSVYNLKATMYDAKGVKIKTYKSGDFIDRSLTSEGTMFDDNRIKELSFLNGVYPFTIEYSYDKDFNGFLSFPSWNPVTAYDTAVEQSSYTIQVPESSTIKFLKSKDLKTDSTLSNHVRNYKWSVQQVASIASEPMSVGMKEITPWVQASPNAFQYDNVSGNVDSWKNLGSWIFDLSKGGQNLPEQTKATVRSLTASAKTDKEKIAILYKFMQTNARYVSVQLGIGGFKPIAAEKVAAVNYGDCKALSNYMKALLETVGIQSHLVMIGADMPSLNPDYSSFGQANHMILCVPAAKDTTWLECTSQYLPAGFLGNSTSNKTVMLVTEAGGKLVNTPFYSPADNYQQRNTTVALTAEGNADILIKTSYGACQYEDHLYMMLRDPTAQRKALLNSLSIPNMEVVSAKYTQSDKDQPKLEEQIEAKGSQMLNQGGDKLFLTLNLLNRNESVPRKVEDRKTSFAVAFGFQDTDEVTYSIPKGYKVEFVPESVKIDSEFGTYTATAVLKGDKLVYTRVQRLNSKRYPPEKYKDAVDFYKKMYLADKLKAVLAKSE